MQEHPGMKTANRNYCKSDWWNGTGITLQEWIAVEIIANPACKPKLCIIATCVGKIIICLAWYLTVTSELLFH